MKRRLTTILMADMAAYSRLMEADEDGTLLRQAQHRQEIIDPAVLDASGRIIKTTGDGILVEFPSVREAVRCAVDIQSAMAAREADQGEATRIRYRIGINIGDVVDQGDDLQGDGINVAARLEQLAEPGGVCISDTVHQLVHGRLDVRFDDLGSQSVKNISRPIRVWQWTPEPRLRMQDKPSAAQSQQINFCIAPDGVQLAWGSSGSGPTVFQMPNWLNHLDYDWSSPIRGPVMQDLSRDHRLVRFDQRGNGLSDWEVDDISFDAMQRDIETVAAAAGLGRVAILGVSQGAAFAVRYAHRFPEKVKCIVICGGYARGILRRNSPGQAELHRAVTEIIRVGWGSPDPAFRHMFTELLLPEGSPLQKSSFDELQRIASSAEVAARINDMNAQVDISDLARDLSVPVLITHAEGDKRIPMEEGRRLAALIPGATFLPLPGSNHMLIPGSAAYEQFFAAFRDFVSQHAA